MIRIAVTPTAFEAIAATLPLGSAGYKVETDDNEAGLIRNKNRRKRPECGRSK
jgi:hypothetical protein